MHPPDYFGIKYEIGPWMTRTRPVGHETAVRQWESLRSRPSSLGAVIELVEPHSPLPDLVFTTNAASIVPGKAVVSRFQHLQRWRLAGM